MSSWPRNEIEPRVFQQVAALALVEAKSRHVLLGWWLPGAAAVFVCGVGALLRLPWPFWAIALGALFVFHRYHRWKLQLLFRTSPCWYWGRLGDAERISRGLRQSHGLMYPIELVVTAQSNIGAEVGEGVLEVNDVAKRVLNFWIDGGVVAELSSSKQVGLLQIGEESVLAAVIEDGDVIISRSLPLPSECGERVRWPR